MNRNFKKIIYGVLYLGIITFIIWIIFFDFNLNLKGSVPVIKDPEFKINVINGIEYFDIGSGKVSFLIEVENPNNEEAAYFSYRFVVNVSGHKTHEIFGDEKLAPGSKEYLVETDIFDNKVNDVEFIVDEGEYRPAAKSINEDVSVKEFNVFLGEDRAVVSGLIDNKSFVLVPRLEVIAVLVDKFGFRLTAGKTVLENVSSFGNRDFEIFIPVNENIKKDIYTTSTETYINLE